MAKDADREPMRRALELAEGGRGRVSPNPLVGAVISRDGEIIGEGFHAELGGLHAEVAALEDCRARGHDPAGATIHVTLEPCAHHGRQPPCAEAILAAGLARVVIASDDPTEKASGRGPELLRERGVEVELADPASEQARLARLLNQAFRKRARSGCPLVVFKAAASLDGFTATAAGDSKWISGEESRALVHAWRAESAAVAVGIGTALADDPLLTARAGDEPAARQPARIVFDSRARLPLGSKLVASVGEAPLFVIVGAEAEPQRIEALRAAGAEPLAVSGGSAERVGGALGLLAERGIDSILLEGGAKLAGAFYDAGEIDELRIFFAPLLLGGGRPLLAGDGAALIGDGRRPVEMSWRQSGDEMLAEARLREW